MRGKTSVQLSDDARKLAVASIRRYVEEELGQEVGDLKASFVLDFFLAELGPVVYNKALADAQTFFAERTADLGALAHEEFTYWPSASRRRA
jgi:uncharacterized protein (DUF2164 family)